MHYHQVTLKLKGGVVVVEPSIIGVQPGDVVKFESNDGEPDIAYEPRGAVKFDPEEGSKRITVLEAPFEFYCALIKDGVRYGWKRGGIGLPDPPIVTGIDSPELVHGSSDVVITLTGSNFHSGSSGLVNDRLRYTQYVNSTTVRITITAADLANRGTLQVAVKNVTTSNAATLTVK